MVPAGTDASVQFNVNAPAGTEVSVDGQAFQTASFTASVATLNAGQRFSFTVKTASGARTYHVRRLPSNFPLPAIERFGTPQTKAI